MPGLVINYIDWLIDVWGKIKDDVKFEEQGTLARYLTDIKFAAGKYGISLGSTKARDLLMVIATQGKIRIEYKYVLGRPSILCVRKEGKDGGDKKEAG